MELSRIPIGRNSPDDLNVVVEIPQGGQPVKPGVLSEIDHAFAQIGAAHWKSSPRPPQAVRDETAVRLRLTGRPSARPIKLP